MILGALSELYPGSLSHRFQPIGISKTFVEYINGLQISWEDNEHFLFRINYQYKGNVMRSDDNSEKEVLCVLYGGDRI